MKRLFIDDIRKPPDDSWTVARTVSAAIKAIAMFDFDVISLDHDISHYENVDESDTDQNVYACLETFQPVAYFIGVLALSDLRNKWDPKVIIHSSNIEGGLTMQVILQTYGINPELKPMGANKINQLGK